LRDINNGLRLKWWWKTFNDLTRKWARLMSQSYRPLSGWWSDRCIYEASASPIWKDMITVKDIFFIGSPKIVYNGRGDEFLEGQMMLE